MTGKINNVAVIGTGVIGTGWIIRFLTNKKKVWVYDVDRKKMMSLKKDIKKTLPHINKLFKKNIKKIENLHLVNSIEDAVKNADFIQECALENEKLKIKIVSEIGKFAKKNAIIASSSSGLLPSKIQIKCYNPKRFVIGHPFNPVYILPLVEVVPGNKTSRNTVLSASKFYESLSMKPLILKKELPGYLSDRLQEALWREALHIINEGYATTQDLDRSIIHGPGLRWSLMGTFLTFHLAGGKEGMAHMLRQFGPALKLPWTKLKAPKLSKKLSTKIISGTKKQSQSQNISQMNKLRDEYLVSLIKLRNRYKKLF